ncbi:hypothetical protein EDD17DRAFT_1649859, partial [Pisolithus thermaeus]
MALFSSVAVALQAVHAANLNAVRLLMVRPQHLRYCKLPIYQGALTTTTAVHDTPCQSSSWDYYFLCAYVLWRARGYLISRILLTFQVNEDKTTTCQVLLI